ncbi:MAG: cupin domain-containing protein [Chloroflexi bacterium]|nr:cupin domain-containing protein [Chloroflexota bacterium]
MGVLPFGEAIEFSPAERVRKIILENDVLEIELLCLEPGQASPRHTHDAAHQVFIVKVGEVELEVESEKARVSPDSLGYAPCGSLHQLTNTGAERAIVIGLKARVGQARSLPSMHQSRK